MVRTFGEGYAGLLGYGDEVDGPDRERLAMSAKNTSDQGCSLYGDPRTGAGPKGLLRLFMELISSNCLRASLYAARSFCVLSARSTSDILDDDRAQ